MFAKTGELMRNYLNQTPLEVMLLADFLYTCNNCYCNGCFGNNGFFCILRREPRGIKIISYLCIGE